MNNFLNNYFGITKKGSTIKTEIIAGITIFLSMSYVLFVIPATLKDGGMPPEAVFSATAISAIISTLLMGIYAKYPIALAPGMGMQAFFTYTIILTMGYSWQEALFGIFVSGLIFILISVTGLRKIILNVVPSAIKNSVSIGIGMFIAFIGMQNIGLVVSDPATIVSLGNILDPVVLVALIGTLITFILVAKNYKLAIFLGMLATIVISIIMYFMGIDTQMSMPTGVVSAPPSIQPIFGQLFTVDVVKLLTDFNFWMVVISILFVDFFDTAGTVFAIGNEVGTIDKDGQIKDAEKILVVDSIGTTIGAVVGVSSVTSYIESLTGIKLGGRTGLSAVVVSICFFIAMFFSPLLSLITVSVTAPALITVGALMAMNNANIDYSDFINAATAFATITIMIFSFSISAGLAAGFIIYTILKTFKKEWQHPLMYVLTFIFIVYFLI